MLERSTAAHRSVRQEGAGRTDTEELEATEAKKKRKEKKREKSTSVGCWDD